MPDAKGHPELPELMIAGPGELHDDDLEALSHQVVAHYGDYWLDLHRHVLEMLAAVMGSSQLPYVIPGTGSTCLDAALFNLFEPKQRVVVANTGFFGTRLIQMATAHGLEVTEVGVELGMPVQPERIADVVNGADGVLSVHVETATGVRHPIEDIAAIAREAGAVCVVDGISSVGGELVDVDALGIHALVTASQKGLEAPPGVGVIALGPGGAERVAARGKRPPSWYLDLQRWDWYRVNWGAWHPHPVTMPTSIFMALASSLERISGFGIEAWVARRADLAKRCREGLRDLGLEPVPAAGVESNLVVAAWDGDPAAIQSHLLERGIMISGGLEPTMGKAIRVGLMGRTATEGMVDRVLAGVSEVLSARP